MRVGTLSLNINTDDLNYGAMLHSWAFQKVLLNMNGIQPEIIDYTIPTLEKFDQKYPVISYLKMGRFKSACKVIQAWSAYRRRAERFSKFIKSNEIISERKYTERTLQENLPYDCLICESDIIWSPQLLSGKFDPAFFLAYKNMPAKKIIYAASMANAQMSEEQRIQFRELIKFPNHISCRESYAAEIAASISGRNVEHVIDPVLLLKAEDYQPICAERKIKEPYLFLYIPLANDDKYVHVAHRYAREKGLKVVEVSFFIWHKLQHTVFPDAGIEDFLSLIRYADCVFTNSFHAVCFSILFHIPFYALDRETGKKTEDLCKLFQLNDYYQNIGHFQELPPIDFDKTDEILNEQQKKSAKWLFNALKV